jgi:hypothetical protein
MRPSILNIFLLIIIAGILGGIGRYGYQFLVDERGYVAILMTTGDVYFGKAETTGGDYVTLSRSYYPQTFTNANGEEELRLVKIGTEFHAPKDAIRLNRDHIIMIQPLSDESPVIASMNEYEASQEQAGAL